MNEFCYLGNRLNSSWGCEAAITARARIGWIKLRECRELLLGNRFPLRMKVKAYVVVTRPLPRDGGMAEDHGAPEVVERESPKSERREEFVAGQCRMR